MPDVCTVVAKMGESKELKEMEMYRTHHFFTLNILVFSLGVVQFSCGGGSEPTSHHLHSHTYTLTLFLVRDLDFLMEDGVATGLHSNYICAEYEILISQYVCVCVFVCEGAHWQNNKWQCCHKPFSGSVPSLARLACF